MHVSELINHASSQEHSDSHLHFFACRHFLNLFGLQNAKKDEEWNQGTLILLCI